VLLGAQAIHERLIRSQRQNRGDAITGVQLQLALNVGAREKLDGILPQPVSVRHVDVQIDDPRHHEFVPQLPYRRAWRRFQLRSRTYPRDAATLGDERGGRERLAAAAVNQGEVGQHERTRCRRAASRRLRGQDRDQERNDTSESAHLTPQCT
jgi:hypothetical protein